MKDVAVALVVFQNQILIGKKEDDNSDLSGQWHIPGGIVDADEDIATAAVRECKEETGLDVRIIETLGSNEKSEHLLHWFLLETNDVTGLAAKDDLVDVKFVSRQEALEMFRERAENEWPKGVLKFLQA